MTSSLCSYNSTCNSIYPKLKCCRFWFLSVKILANLRRINYGNRLEQVLRKKRRTIHRSTKLLKGNTQEIFLKHCHNCMLVEYPCVFAQSCAICEICMLAKCQLCLLKFTLSMDPTIRCHLITLALLDETLCINGWGTPCSLPHKPHS